MLLNKDIRAAKYLKISFELELKMKIEKLETANDNKDNSSKRLQILNLYGHLLIVKFI